MAGRSRSHFGRRGFTAEDAEGAEELKINAYCSGGCGF